MTEAESDALATASAGDKHTAPDFYGTFPSPAASLTAAAMQSGARIVKYDGGTGATSTQETPTNNSTRSVITSITATHNPTVDGYQYNGIWQLCFGLNTFSGFYVYASTTHDQYLSLIHISEPTRPY